MGRPSPVGPTNQNTFGSAGTPWESATVAPLYQATNPLVGQDSHWTRVREGGGEDRSLESGYRAKGARRVPASCRDRFAAKRRMRPAMPAGLPAWKHSRMSDAFIPCFAGGWMASFSFQAPGVSPEVRGGRAPVSGLVSIDPTRPPWNPAGDCRDQRPCRNHPSVRRPSDPDQAGPCPHPRPRGPASPPPPPALG